MNSNIHVYIHLVWSTWDRLPVITGRAKDTVYSTVVREASQLGCNVLAVGGIDDHIHVLLTLPSTIPICQVVQKVKNQSSLLAGPSFKWQGAYSAISVTPRHVRQIVSYIEGQAEHHRAHTIHVAWEPES